MHRGTIIASTLVLGLYAACNVSSNTDELEDDVRDQVDAAVDAIGSLEICDGMTLEELQNAVTISAECKATLEAYLPDSASNFKERIVVLGEETTQDGSLRIYLHGVDADGVAFDAEDYAAAEVAVSDGAGGFTLLGEGSFTITLIAEAPAPFLSLGMVNDYSGSMLEQDLETVAEIETDLLTVLPPVYEAEVTLFSTSVGVKQAFSEDRDTLLAAVARDTSFERDLTALYDGMGTGLDSLVSRERPAKVLLVSTDGHENSSTSYTKSQLVQTVSEQGVVVIMLGALFADVGELEDLAGPRGIYFYTPLYDDLRAQLEQLLTSLANMAQVELPAEQAQERPIRISVGGVTTEIE